MDSFVSALSEKNSKLLHIVLFGMEKVLEIGNELNPNPFIEIVFAKFDRLEKLLYHSSDDVNTTVARMIEIYFPDDTEM